jgi:ubiquitin-small subunit ribosomal protein S27Ae
MAVAKKKVAEKPKKEGKKLSALYNVSSDSISRKNKFCPKCGPGMFMAAHGDRVVCGKCSYTEYVGKQEEKPVTVEAEN